jgi:hypothetical protein
MHRLLTEVGVSIGASAVMVIVTIVGGQLVAATAIPAASDGDQSAEASCLEQPLALTEDTAIQALTRLCLTMDGVQPTVELTGLSSGGVYTAWLSYLEHPRTRQIGRCASAQIASQVGDGTPGRLDSRTADQGGRVILSGVLPGLHPEGNTEIEILVVDHGRLAAGQTPASARQLLVWNPTWSGQPTTVIGEEQAASRLVGCAAFWLRGGAELTEH